MRSQTPKVSAGAKGVAHILEARMRKDGMTREESLKLLPLIVEGIARGTPSKSRFKDNKAGIAGTKAVIHYGGVETVLIRRDGEDAWLLTGYEKPSDASGQGGGKTGATHAGPTPPRPGMGAEDTHSLGQGTDQGNPRGKTRGTIDAPIGIGGPGSKSVEPFQAQYSTQLRPFTMRPTSPPKLDPGHTLVDTAIYRIKAIVPKRDQQLHGFAPTADFYRIGVAKNGEGALYAFAEYPNGFAERGDQVDISYKRLPTAALENVHAFRGMNAAARKLFDRHENKDATDDLFSDANMNAPAKERGVKSKPNRPVGADLRGLMASPKATPADLREAAKKALNRANTALRAGDHEKSDAYEKLKKDLFAHADKIQPEHDRRQMQALADARREAAQKKTSEVADGPKEGDTKSENGVQYVLKDGRWHRADEPTKELPRGAARGGPGEIGALFDAVQSESFPKNEKRAVWYATEPTDKDNLVSEAAGVDVSGWSHSVDSFAMRKVHKDHGHERSEAPRGQSPITKEDWAKLPEIVRNYDTVDPAGTDQHGTPLIRYSKRFNGTTYYVEEVRGKRRELAAKTMWKTRTAMSGAEGPALTSQNVQPESPQGRQSIGEIRIPAHLDQDVEKENPAGLTGSDGPGSNQEPTPTLPYAGSTERLAPAGPKDKPDIIEHVTKRGKTLRGIIRTDLTKDEALAIDPYTFRKDGGYFIRERHLGDATAPTGKPRALFMAPNKNQEPSPQEGTGQDTITDNQGRNLAAVKRHQDLLEQHHEKGLKAQTKDFERKKAKVPLADWTQVTASDGTSVDVLRAGESSHVAVPLGGRKDAKTFQIVNVNDESEPDLPQLTKQEVREWLWKRGLREHEERQEDGPKEGDTKTENGIPYVLKDGRWHRASDAQAHADSVLDARGVRVADYVEAVLSKQDVASKLPIGKLGKDAADKIRQHTGQDVDGSTEVVVASNVVHSSKRHPDMTRADWLALPYLTNRFDEASMGRQEGDKAMPRIVVRRMDGEVGYGAVLAYAQSGRNGKRLNVVTYPPLSG